MCTLRIKTAARMAWAAYTQRRWAVLADCLIVSAIIGTAIVVVVSG